MPILSKPDGAGKIGTRAKPHLLVGLQPPMPPRDKVDYTPNRVYTAYGAARQLWGCRAEEILIDGPAGTGKTRAILEKVVFCAMKYPGMRALLVRKTRESMTETVLVTLEEKVIPEGSGVLFGPRRNLRQVYNFPNKAQIVIAGMDKPGKIMSSEYDIIGVFEATELTEEDFEALTTRLRNHVMPYQQIIADCNPGPPSHWLIRRPASKGTVRLMSKHKDNPLLFDHKLKVYTDSGKRYLGKLDRLTGVRRLRLRKGIWAAAEGVVYPDFQEDIHVIKAHLPPFPKTWRRVRSIDFGFRAPFCCQWWAVDHDGRMYLYKEIYRTGKIVADHAEDIKRLSGDEVYETTVCDWDAEDRETLDRAGIFTQPAYKAIRPGIEAVEARLRVQSDEKPRIFFLQDALQDRDPFLDDANLPFRTTQEFESYIYKKSQEGKPLKEDPKDEYNHGMDAMRYAVAYVDNLSGFTINVTGEQAMVVTRELEVK